MKRLILFAFLFTTMVGNSQNILTIGEIFDFNINDEFQSSNVYPTSGPPNAIRMKITDKHFSTTNDTVFYTRFFDNYSTVYNPNPTPHLDYIFNSYTDSVFYTNLDSSIFDSPWYPVDTIIDSTICGIITCGWEFNGLQEYYSKIYGKGLGIVRDVGWVDGSDDATYDVKLGYFKKDSVTCGTPDLTTSIGINNLSAGIEKIFPNPFTDVLNIIFANDQQSYVLKIYDIRGVEILDEKIDHNKNVIINRINEKGVYIIKLESEGKIYLTRAIKI
jgi:hypothetical protein